MVLCSLPFVAEINLVVILRLDADLIPLVLAVVLRILILHVKDGLLEAR